MKGEFMSLGLQKAAYFTIAAFGIILATQIFFKYLFDALVPFICGGILSLIALHISKKLSAFIKIPQKPLALTVLILLFAAAIALISSAIIRLTKEAEALCLRLSENPTQLSQAFGQLLDTISSKLSVIPSLFPSVSADELAEHIGKICRSGISTVVSSLSSSIPQAIIGTASKLPAAVLSVIALFSSAFFFCTDKDKILSYLNSILPPKALCSLSKLKITLKKALKGYFKAYFILFIITFCMIFVGLSIIGIEYAFLISLIISAVDMLPVIGAGTVLLPWSLIALAMGNAKVGISILILFASVLIVRQLAEPKVVGKSLGLHPLASLLSVIIATHLLGFKGIFIGPLVAIFAREIINLSND
jgi:sporulation integral membrane protein YtvI